MNERTDKWTLPPVSSPLRHSLQISGTAGAGPVRGPLPGRKDRICAGHLHVTRCSSQHHLGPEDRTLAWMWSQEASQLPGKNHVLTPQKEIPVQLEPHQRSVGPWMSATPTRGPPGGRQRPGSGRAGPSAGLWTARPSSSLKWNQSQSRKMPSGAPQARLLPHLPPAGSNPEALHLLQGCWRAPRCFFRSRVISDLGPGRRKHRAQWRGDRLGRRAKPNSVCAPQQNRVHGRLVSRQNWV